MFPDVMPLAEFKRLLEAYTFDEVYDILVEFSKENESDENEDYSMEE